MDKQTNWPTYNQPTEQPTNPLANWQASWWTAWLNDQQTDWPVNLQTSLPTVLRYWLTKHVHVLIINTGFVYGWLCNLPEYKVMWALFILSSSDVRPGRCPKNGNQGSQNCDSDADCPNNEKCCNSNCTKPLSLGKYMILLCVFIHTG
jgi:hypothetical protein